MLKEEDLTWLAASPLYVVISATRHEGAHALVIWLLGGEVIHLVVWPSVNNELGHFAFGYVIWSGAVHWLVSAAPYIGDLLTFTIFSWLIWRFRLKRWVFINFWIIGIVSPLANSLFNYHGGVLWGGNDIGRLLEELPALMVHIYFVFTLLLYIVGMVLSLYFSPTARAEHPKKRK